MEWLHLLDGHGSIYPFNSGYYEDPPIVASNSGISWGVLEGVTNLLTPPTTVTLTWSMWKIRMSCGYIALKQTTSKVRAYAS